MHDKIHDGKQEYDGLRLKCLQVESECLKVAKEAERGHDRISILEGDTREMIKIWKKWVSDKLDKLESQLTRSENQREI